MIKLLSHRAVLSSLFQLALEGGLFFIAMLAAVAIHSRNWVPLSGNVLPAALLFSGLMVGVNGSLGLYRHSRAANPFQALTGRAALMIIVGWPVAYVVFYFFVPMEREYQNVLGYAILMGLSAIVLVRGLLFYDNSARFFTHRVLVLGTGEEALNLQRAMSRSTSSAVEVVGFYPVKGQNQPAVAAKQILSPAVALHELVRSLDVDEIIVAVREQRGGIMPIQDLLNCRLQGTRVTDLPAFFERVNGEVPVESLKASWLIYGDGFRQGLGRTIVKRIFDVLAATLLFIPGIPIMLLAALAIFLETGGPVLLRQERVGLGGRTFSLLKFRSMHKDAEQDGRPRWANAGDARITRVGRFIRRTRIDELPQLFNVLKGDMSFVGPRPERPFFVAQLSEKIPFYGARHSVKPGITGWAQVRYPYASSVEDACKKLQFDLYYVKNHTLPLDLVILFETVRVVLLGEGAR